MRRNYDVKVYLAPEEELRIQWKIKRDTAKRGYTPEQVRASLEKRIPDSRDFIRPQRAYADVVVTFYRPPGHEEETGAHLNARLILRPTLPHPDLTELLECAEENRQMLCSTVGREDGRLVEILEIGGQIGNEKTRELAEVIWGRVPGLPHLQLDQMGVFLDGAIRRRSNPLTLAQLLITYHMLVAMKELREG
ncbi:MAG TPA: hypothetical protein EYP04_09255 [Anaerolineae bacterium]|nr:hypothetical protein [Anaerolineae bacterium]